MQVIENIIVFWVRSLIASLMVLAFFVGSAFANPQLLVDMENGEILFEKDAGQPWYPASLTKLTTALVVFNAIKNNRITLQTPVLISALARRAPGGKSGLAQGRAVSMEDALELLIVKSANDIAIAIAQTVSGSVESFVVEMNLMARTVGMSATRFANPHGLNNSNQVTSARDLAILALTIRGNFPQYGALFATSIVEVNGNKLETNNNLLTEFGGTTGMKTGFICAAGMNIVATVERSGRKLLAIVLGASSKRERGEMVGQVILEYLSGPRGGTGRVVTGILNITNQAPVNMRARLCGNQAANYLAERKAAFAYGLPGEASFLTDIIAPLAASVDVMVRMPAIPHPRPRLQRSPNVAALIQDQPDGSSISSIVTINAPVAQNVPVPKPRIHR